MFASTFIFAKKQFDDDFFNLDQAIADVAKQIPGYLGEETWVNPDTGLVSNVYYWETMAALQQLMQHPQHQQAKREQARWLSGYQVVIAEVIQTYADGQLSDLPTSAILNRAFKKKT